MKKKANSHHQDLMEKKMKTLMMNQLKMRIIQVTRIKMINLEMKMRVNCHQVKKTKKVLDQKMKMKVNYHQVEKMKKDLG